MFHEFYRLDLRVFRAIHLGWHHRILDVVFWLLTWMGDGTVQAILVLSLFWSKRFKKYMWPLAASLVFGGLLGAQGIKHLLPRERPSNLPWAHPEELIYSNSFPSGHTTSSFALSVMFVLLTWRTRDAWIAWVSVGLSVLVGLSRVYRGVHWPSDVLGGACVGTFFAGLIYLSYRARWPSRTP